MKPLSRRDAMAWFRNEFGREVVQALQGTPFNLDLLTAISYQETGYIYSLLKAKGMGRGDILRLCVGDSLDSPKRKAFPRTAAELKELTPHGSEIFTVARQALIEMSEHVPGYKVAASKQTKFCHGFGIFQYDIQHAKKDPLFFKEKRWHTFSESLGKAISELSAAQSRVPSLKGKTALTDEELIQVAIAYNRGSYKPSLGLRQGHFNGSQYYGEAVHQFYHEAKMLPGPQPLSKLRLILAAPQASSASALDFKEMVTAELVEGRFKLSAKEAGDFLGIESEEKTVFLADFLNGAGLSYVVSDRHKKHPVNPRIYVFIGRSPSI